MIIFSNQNSFSWIRCSHKWIWCSFLEKIFLINIKMSLTLILAKLSFGQLHFLLDAHVVRGGIRYDNYIYILWLVLIFGIYHLLNVISDHGRANFCSDHQVWCVFSNMTVNINWLHIIQEICLLFLHPNIKLAISSLTLEIIFWAALYL